MDKRPSNVLSPDDINKVNKMAALSNYTFPIVYWHKFDSKTLTYITNYTEVLVSYMSYNKLASIIKALDPAIQSTNKNSLKISKNKQFSLIKLSSRIDQRTLIHLAEDNFSPVMLKIQVNGHEYLINITSSVVNLKHNYDNVLSSDINVLKTWFKQVTIGLMKLMWRRLIYGKMSNFIKKLFGSSVGTEVWSTKFLSERALYDMNDVFVLIDAERLDLNTIEKLFDPMFMSKMYKIGWVSFILYFPSKETIMYIVRRSEIRGYMQSEGQYLYRIISLNALKNYVNIKNKTLTKDDLIDVMTSTTNLKRTTAFNIVKQLISVKTI